MSLGSFDQRSPGGFGDLASVGTLMNARRRGGAAGPVSTGALADAASGVGSTSNFSGSAGPPVYYIADDPSGPKVMMFTESVDARSMGVAGIAGVEERARLIDYNTKELLGEYFVANDQTVLDDNHTIGAGCTDRWGYHRFFYGDHATQSRGKRSAVPWLASGTWIDIPIQALNAGQIDARGGFFTYHKPIIVPGIDKIFLFQRGYEQPADGTRTPPGNTIGTSHLTLMIFDIDAAGNTTQNGNRIDLVDFRLAGPTLARFYSGHFAQRGTKIYIVAAWADAADTIRKGVYVFAVDVVDGVAANMTLSDFAASHVVTAGSFPMNKTDADTYCRWVSMDAAGTEGTTPQICLDPINWAPALGAHVFYTEGVPLSNTYQAKHRYHDGTSLQAASVISNQPTGSAQNHAGCCGVIRADGTITAQTVTQGDYALARGGDHSRAIWTKAGGWQAPYIYMKQTDANRPYDTSVPIKDGPDDMAIATTQVTLASQTVKDGMLRAFISGAAPRAAFIGSQYGPDVQSIINRMYDSVGSKPDATWCAAAKTLNETLRDNSLWTRFYTLQVPFCHVAGADLINWRNSRFPLSVTGSPVFTAYSGRKCVSGGYYDSGIPINRLADTNFALFIAANGLLGSGFGSALAGCITTGNNLNFANNSAGSLAFNKAASAGTASVASAGLDSAVMIGQRVGATQTVYENGVLRATATATNSASNTENILFGRRLTVSSAANFLALGSTTGIWTTAETLIAYNAFKTFFNAKTPGTMA